MLLAMRTIGLFAIAFDLEISALADMGGGVYGHTFLFLQFTHDNRVFLSDERRCRPSGWAGDVVSIGVLVVTVRQTVMTVCTIETFSL